MLLTMQIDLGYDKTEKHQKILKKCWKRHWSIHYNYTDTIIRFLECIIDQKDLKKDKIFIKQSMYFTIFK